MTNRLLTGARVWPAITRAAKARPNTAFAATPYFGKRGADLLPLRRGSRLVVDASKHAVGTGQTCPQALLRLCQHDVRVFNCPGLHAKVYVFGRVAFVGSANASSSSADALIEAVIQTSERRTVTEAREFVRELSRSLVPLGEEQLRKLATYYREPRRVAAKRATGRRQASGSRTWIVHPWESVLPETAEEAFDDGLERAERVKSSRKHEIESFWSQRRIPYQRDDIVVEIFHERSGRVMVIPPGTIIRRQGWRRGDRRMTFIYYERPQGRRVEFTRLAKALGYGARKRLLRQGPLAEGAFRDSLLGYFSERR